MTRPSKKKQILKKCASALNMIHTKGSAKALWRAQKFKSTANKSKRHKLIIDTPSLDKYFLVENGCELKAIIIGVLKHDYPLMVCNHFLVGSSRCSDLLSGTLSPQKSHSYFITHAFRRFGKIAESAAFKKFSSKKPQCLVSGKLPFVCAAPDLVIKDRIIEIKSTSTVRKIQPKDILQVLVSMEIFKKNFAEIHIYRTLGVYEPQTKLIEVIGIEKTAVLFSDLFVKYSIRGYITYLISLLHTIGIFPNEQARLEALNLLFEQAQTDDSPFKAPSLITSELCHKYFSYKKYKDKLAYQKCKNAVWNQSLVNSQLLESDSLTLSHKDKKSGYYENKGDVIECCNSIYSNYLVNSIGISLNKSEYMKNNRMFVSLFQEQENEPIVVLPEKDVAYSSYRFDDDAIETFLRQYTDPKISGVPTDDFVFHSSRIAKPNYN